MWLKFRQRLAHGASTLSESLDNLVDYEPLSFAEFSENPSYAIPFRIKPSTFAAAHKSSWGINAKGCKRYVKPEQLAGLYFPLSSEFDFEAPEANVEKHGTLDADWQQFEFAEFYQGMRNVAILSVDMFSGRVRRFIQWGPLRESMVNSLNGDSVNYSTLFI